MISSNTPASTNSLLFSSPHPLPMPLAVRQKKKATKGDGRRRARRQYRQAQHAQTRQAITRNHARSTCLAVTASLILAASALILNPSWLILSLAPILSWFLQLLILRYPHLAHQPELQALKSLTQVINQALMLASLPYTFHSCA